MGKGLLYVEDAEFFVQGDGVVVEVKSGDDAFRLYIPRSTFFKARKRADRAETILREGADVVAFKRDH